MARAVNGRSALGPLAACYRVGVLAAGCTLALAQVSAASPPPEESPPPKGQEVQPQLELRQVTPPKSDDQLLPMFPAKAPEKRGSGKPTYQLRCWQRGALLFSENDMSEATALAFLERNQPKATGKAPEKLPVGQMQVINFGETLCALKRRG